MTPVLFTLEQWLSRNPEWLVPNMRCPICYGKGVIFYETTRVEDYCYFCKGSGVTGRLREVYLDQVNLDCTKWDAHMKVMKALGLPGLGFFGEVRG